MRGEGGGYCFIYLGGGKLFFCRGMAKWSSIDLVCCAGFFLFSILSIAAGFFYSLFLYPSEAGLPWGESFISFPFSWSLEKKKESGEEI